MRKGKRFFGRTTFSWAALDKALINTIAATSMTTVKSKAIRLNMIPPSFFFDDPLRIALPVLVP